MDLPTCPDCGQLVKTARSPDGEFSAWCGCALVSPNDRNFREVGHGMTAEEAVERWREWRR